MITLSRRPDSFRTAIYTLMKERDQSLAMPDRNVVSMDRWIDGGRTKRIGTCFCVYVCK